MTAPAPLDLPALLDDLERAHAAATPGEWERDGEYPAEIYNGRSGEAERLVAECHNNQDACHSAADAALIVAAVNAVPTLIAELRKRAPAPSPAAEPPHDLREALVRWLAQRYSDGSALEMRGIRDDTDALLAGPLALLLDLRQRVEGLADSWEALAAEYDGAAAAITTPSLIEEARGHAEDIRASVGGLRRALDGTP